MIIYKGISKNSSVQIHIRESIKEKVEALGSDGGGEYTPYKICKYL